MPIVSVMVLTHNRAAFLAKALESIVAQTFQDLEIIVCDNDSTDDTPEVVQSFRDPRIVHVRHPLDVGGWNTYWMGLVRARGQLVLSTHDDDMMGPTLVEREVEVMRSAGDVALVTANVSHIDDAGGFLQERRIPLDRDIRFGPGDYVRRYIEDHFWLPTPTMMVRTDFMRSQMRNFRVLGPATDIGMFCFINADSPVHFIADPLLSYRQHATQHTRRIDATDASFLLYEYLVELCDTHERLRSLAPRARARLLTYRGERAALVLAAGRLQTPELAARIRELRAEDAKTTEICDETLRFDLLFHYASGESRSPSAASPPVSHGPPRRTADFYRIWLDRIRAGSPGPCARLRADGVRRIVIVGSMLTAFLIASDARAQSVEVVRFVDSSSDRQNQYLAGVAIEPHRWLASHPAEYDAVVLSSEGANDQGLRRTLHSLGVRPETPILSWKELIAPDGTLAPPGPRNG